MKNYIVGIGNEYLMNLSSENIFIFLPIDEANKKFDRLVEKYGSAIMYRIDSYKLTEIKRYKNT